MLKNYFKVAFRSLLRRKGFTLINVLGLATGMAACLLIVLYIRSELGFDRFHEKNSQIYRVALERKYPGRSTSYALIPPAIGASMQHEFPEIQQCTRLFDIVGNGSFLIKIADKVFEEKRVLAADSNFFTVFTAPLLQGDAATALQKINTAVITESTAKKYFGSAANAIGKSFESDGAAHYIITGVCKDWPENAHFIFDVLVSSVSFAFTTEPNYTGFSAHTYLLLNKQASPEVLEAKFPGFLDKYVSPAIAKGFNMTWQQFQSAGNGYRYFLQPLTQIHLTSDLSAELRINGNIKTIYIFSVIAFFILAIACINFINLSTARSLERAKEVGIRKTFGSEKKSLVLQFLLESVLVSLASAGIAFLLMLLVLPLFNTIAGKELSVAWFITPLRAMALLLFAIVAGLAAGIYPAFVLSSFKPMLVLKGKFKSNRYGMVLRNGLVIFQFSISVILIICTFVVNRQMQYMQGDALGFKKDHIIEIMQTQLLANQTEAFRNGLAGIPGVEAISGASSFPGQDGFFGISFQPLGSREAMTGRAVIADEAYAPLMNIQMKEGRFFSKEFLTDSLGIVLNEKAVREMGLTNAVGTRLTTTEDQFNAPDGRPYQYTVLGVIKDFHYQSLHQQITPLIFINARKFGNVSPVTAIRIKADNFAAAVPAIEKSWKQFVPERPFHYDFLDRSLANQYQAEQTMQRIFTIFSVLAVFIGCIGLLGLAAYATQLRVREISIRKVLGASAGNIVTLLSRDFLRLIIIATLLAFPLAWWGMHSWLQHFAYRTSIAWWIFLLAGAMATAVALLTISFQAIKAALANPAERLRTE